MIVGHGADVREKTIVVETLQETGFLSGEQLTSERRQSGKYVRMHTIIHFTTHLHVQNVLKVLERGRDGVEGEDVMITVRDDG